MYQKIFTLFILGILLTTQPVLSQMFSVSDKRTTVAQPSSILRIGAALTDFTYVGNAAQNEPELLNVNQPVFALSFETMGLSANVLLGNRLSGFKDASFFDLNIRFTNGINIVKKQRLQFGIPIQLSTGLTTSNSDFYEDRFNQSHFGGGSGLFLDVRPHQKLQTNLSAIAGYAFSNSNGGFFGGTLFYNNLRARIHWLNAIGERTLSFGYDYFFKRYDIDVNLYDYDLAGHQFTLGISL